MFAAEGVNEGVSIYSFFLKRKNAIIPISMAKINGIIDHKSDIDDSSDVF